jgi:hypothetical protein
VDQYDENLVKGTDLIFEVCCATFLCPFNRPIKRQNQLQFLFLFFSLAML